MKIMDRIETLEYLKDKNSKKERLIISRYNDGEYLLMNNTKRYIAKSNSGELSELLKKSIKAKGQFICINYLKPHNIEKKDRWYDTQNYLIKESGNLDLYGCSLYSTYDFSNDSSLIVKHFFGKVLLVTGLTYKLIEFFNGIKTNIDFYKAPPENAVLKYEEIKNYLLKVCNNYDNILFSCGPLSNVLISDLINECNCNLINFGSVINAILNLTNDWTMSWTKNVNMEEKIKNFKNNLKEKISD